MDLCSLEDAFPDDAFPKVGGTDTYSSKEERRAARKLAKKVKGPALTYMNSVSGDIPDPDRPAVKRMDPIAEVTKEKFALPVLPKASCLFSDTGLPSYFGRAVDDEEGFSSYSASPKDDANYRLHPDFTEGDLLKGVQKAAGTLPEPELSDTWKPISPAASYTAFFNEDPPKRAEVLPPPPPKWLGSDDSNNSDALLKRIDELMGRLEQLENKKSRDSQAEILMFVGTGLFLLVSFDLMTRK